MNDGDLISRSALLQNYEHFLARASIDPVIRAFMTTVCCTVKNAPTIDAVEVVRCKDCDFSRHIYQENGGVFRGTLHCAQGRGYQMNTPDREYSVISPNSYCAAGKRKMDAEVEG